MSSNLRTILRKHQEDQALRNYLGLKFDTTTSKDKKRFIEAISSSVDREVDGILKTFLEEIQEGSPEKKKRRNLALLVMLVSIISSAGIGYGVNLENWVMVGIFVVIMLIIQGYNIFNE